VSSRDPSTEVIEVEYDPRTRSYVAARPPRRFPWLHAGLFALTVASTVLVGGPWYALAILTILLAHEMGHYLMSRRYGVRASLPYFLPMPLSPIGTLGAVIRMEARIPNRTVLFDIGIAGPLAGLVFTIPAILIGLALSTVVTTATPRPDTLPLGESLLFSMLSRLVKGELGPGQDVLLHPIAFAGWVGLLVTALNLLPVSQLDGGHVLYGLLGQRSRRVSIAVYAAFLAMTIIKYRNWLPLAILILIFRPEHPPTVDATTPVSRSRRLLGILSFLLFAISFTPVPFLIG
jgi:membrane-associated protease RseP (regulator of RpoE activity)